MWREAATTRLEIKRTSITRLKLRCPWCLWVFSLTWNQKNLDYEIETHLQESDRAVIRFLEIKRTSITRLKRAVQPWPQYPCNLEIKRTSITRLKPSMTQKSRTMLAPWNQKNLDYEIETSSLGTSTENPMTLEIKRTSITRLKLFTWQKLWYCFSKNLKSKEPRLRDWNLIAATGLTQGAIPWNQKNLDYEIETRYQRRRLTLLLSLEIKRTSITRLKPLKREAEGIPAKVLKSKEPRLRDWNSDSLSLPIPHTNLEIKRTSITRLKLWVSIRDYGGEYLFTLKSKEPRLRDWNPFYHRYCISLPQNLKSKEPRLRDWNAPEARGGLTERMLEIKRTSITRLKLSQDVRLPEIS